MRSEKNPITFLGLATKNVIKFELSFLEDLNSVLRQWALIDDPTI